MAELMHGASAVKKFVNEYLAIDLPTRLVSYRNGWGLDDESLPEPLLYLPYEPVGLDTWPTIITVVISTNQLTRDGYTDLYDPEYRVRYSMRTYIWVKDDHAELVTAQRDNLTTVVRAALLDGPSLRRCDANNREVMLEESSIREEFSDLTLLKGDRVMAGAYLAYDINLTEVVSRSNINDSIGDIDIEGMMIGEL